MPKLKQQISRVASSPHRTLYHKMLANEVNHLRREINRGKAHQRVKESMIGFAEFLDKQVQEMSQDEEGPGRWERLN